MRKAAIAIVVAALLAMAGMAYRRVRQRLESERQEIGTRWVVVDSAMQRRADLIFTLAAPMKGLSSESDDVVGKISEGRAMLAAGQTPREKIAAYDRLNVAIARLLAAVRNERRLRSGANLAHLPDNISNTENEVNVARQKYNEALENYNTALQLFPNNIVAKVSGFHRNDAYIQTGAGGQASKVQF